MPIIISIWIAQNVDIYTLSCFAPEDEVGLYRLANRMGAFLDYFTAALFMAWTPLRGSSTFAAAVPERGKDALGGRSAHLLRARRAAAAVADDRGSRHPGADRAAGLLGGRSADPADGNRPS